MLLSLFLWPSQEVQHLGKASLKHLVAKPDGYGKKCTRMARQLVLNSLCDQKTEGNNHTRVHIIRSSDKGAFGSFHSTAVQVVTLTER